MQFDPENKVVKLCAEGMQAEAEGNIDKAHAFFQQAWDIAENDFEAFTAAHYLARNQKNPDDSLKWNLEALKRADAVGGDSLNSYYPSLYLNAGRSYENLNNIPEANRYYRLAADCSNLLPAGSYGEMIKSGIASALQRTGTSKFNNPELEELVNRWCGRKDLKPLSLLLPAYVSNLGTDNDRNRLISALSYLSATRCLPDDEQGVVDRLVGELAN